MWYLSMVGKYKAKMPILLGFFSYRPYWRCYYSNTDAIIYVVDSMDKDRIGISKQELIAMLEVT